MPKASALIRIARSLNSIRSARRIDKVLAQAQLQHLRERVGLCDCC